MKRFFPQVAVPEIGKNGQELISKSKILVVGAGGLAAPLLTYLSAFGLAEIAICDGDTIDETNLQRQFYFSDEDLGKQKCSVIANHLKSRSIHTKVTEFPVFLTKENSEKIVEKYDIICDTTDHAETKILLDEICFLQQKPLVFASVLGWIGYISVFNYDSKTRLTDFFTNEELIENNNSCQIQGVVPSVCGVVGSLQATEVLKIILKKGEILDGKILCFDGLKNQLRVLKKNF